MKHIITLSLFFFIAAQLPFAQQYQEITTGPNYTSQAFFHLNDDMQTTIANNSWDLAFAVYSRFSVTVRMNESSGINPATDPGITIYNTRSTDFNSTPVVDSFQQYPLYNNDSISWDMGALNTAADPADQLDYGWGSYDQTTHGIIGSRVFVIKLRNGEFRKFKIVDLAAGKYTLIHGDLNSTAAQAQSQVIDTKHYPGKYFAYFNFTSNEVLDLEPERYDLVYQRYITPLHAGGGQFLEYTVTGILGSPETQIVQADEVNPATVDYREFLPALNAYPDEIGHDWKEFDGDTYRIIDNRVYFVKNTTGNIYKIRFIDFEGSATGTAVFEKEWVGNIASAVKNNLLGTGLIYPNPASDEVNVIFAPLSIIAQHARLTLTDLNGKPVFSANVSLQPGLNALTVKTSVIPAGTYIVRLQGLSGEFTDKLQVIK